MRRMKSETSPTKKHVENAAVAMTTTTTMNRDEGGAGMMTMTMMTNQDADREMGGDDGSTTTIECRYSKEETNALEPTELPPRGSRKIRIVDCSSRLKRERGRWVPRHE
jgi:hypothetical protein